ncbi:integral membrane protein, YkoY family [Terribacillus halophilus]|uniref:Integral membrane protein, YkoY family n=1 Tax=Terribacillus halophilus TaxID=361279 RepID=A0A1G6I6B6_9BACI|nr:TerC family protein [Terribacillus halophilus]SDC01990.1 integral membrane protein, YkoY family [Terribacillus halophilus]
MDAQLLFEYGWVLIVLVGLEGILAADNALVLAIMVRHLPEEQRKKALFYGLMGAFILRFASLFVISFLVDVWQVQAIGAAYLLFISIKNLYDRFSSKNNDVTNKKPKKESGFWMTVLKVELADLAFAVDSILAAVALAVALPPTGWGEVGSLDTGQFAVVLAGGMIGIIIMRFAANIFVDLLHTRPALEVAAFIIVGWVGVKLVVSTLSHDALGILPHDFAHSTPWKLIFYGVLVAIAVIGWIVSGKNKVEHKKEDSAQETE